MSGGDATGRGLTREDRALLNRAMRFIIEHDAAGGDIFGPDLETVFGRSREELWDDTDSDPARFEEILNNLLGYPHGGWKRIAAATGLTEERAAAMRVTTFWAAEDDEYYTLKKLSDLAMTALLFPGEGAAKDLTAWDIADLARVLYPPTLGIGGRHRDHLGLIYGDFLLNYATREETYRRLVGTREQIERHWAEFRARY